MSTLGSKLKQNVTSLCLEKGDDPELDMPEELDANSIKDYQSLIGALQWAVSLRGINITATVMTMSGFRVPPRKGQWKCAMHHLAPSQDEACCCWVLHQTT